MIRLWCALASLSFFTTAIASEMEHASEPFREVTPLFSTQAFEDIKHFVLDEGDRLTYRNLDNCNPHYQIDDLNIFLGSDVGQANLFNDPALSNFNELIAGKWHFVIVREGDRQEGRFRVLDGMKEGEVYLLNPRNESAENVETALADFLARMEEEMEQPTFTKDMGFLRHCQEQSRKKRQSLKESGTTAD